MKQHGKVCLLIMVSFGLLNLGFAPVTVAWQKIANGITEGEVRCVSVHPFGADIIFAGTSKAIYRSENRGKSFRPVLVPHGRERAVNHVFINTKPPYDILAATDSGIYQSDKDEIRWEKIYGPADDLLSRCHAVIRRENIIYAGTAKGLFTKKSDDPVWRKADGILGDVPIYELAQDENFLYIATAARLYREGVDGREIIFTIGAQERDEQVEDFEPVEEVETVTREIKDVFVEADESIWIAAPVGIFTSKDHGENWSKLPGDGASPEDKMSIVVSSHIQASHGTGTFGGENASGGARDLPSTPPQFGGGRDVAQDEGTMQASVRRSIFVATDNGVLRLLGGQWISLFKGMETAHINDLSMDRIGRLYAATDSGLFFMDAGKAVSVEDLSTETLVDGPDQRDAMIRNMFDHEPAIRAVQEMAIDYAEVHPDKIKEWRVLARKRAWLPSVNIGLDVDKNKTTANSVWGTYTNGGQLFIGPNDKTFYDNLGWGISLSWDLGDLVWSTDATTIDSRSKLMVELREDVLDQVTRLYFERRRLQVELAAHDSVDWQIKMDSKMRIDELTALIDALTGGRFSRTIDAECRTGCEKR